MKSLNKISSLLSRSVLLVLFISYTVCTVMFYHTHVVQGFLITHSHPYRIPSKKGPVEDHSHTTSQYFLLQHLCSTSMTDSISDLAFVPDPVYVFLNTIISPYKYHFPINVKLTESLRAPPVC